MTTTAVHTHVGGEAGRAGLPRPLRWVWRAVVVVVLAAAALVLVACVVVPRIVGATPYAILTGSMQPGLPPGTLVVTKPVDPAKISVGTVVTYQLQSGRPAVVTHRVVGVGSTTTGELRFTTQGDANDVADALPVRPDQVRGAVLYAVPVVGRANTLITGEQHQLLVYLAAAGLIGYGVAMLGSARLGRAQRGTDRAEGEP